MLDVALAHARRGLKVFPLTPNAKTPPLIKAWQEQATTAEKQIREWWNIWPDANVGVECSGLLVVDCDARKNGFESLARLEREIGDLGATFEVETPGDGVNRGRHLYYRLSEGVNVSNGADVLGAGLDLKTSRGYVLAAGCRTPNGEYAPFNDEPIVEALPELIARCRAAATPVERITTPIETDEDAAIARAVDYLRTREPAIEGKGGDDWTLKTCMLVKDMGVPEHRMAEALAEWNARCSPPWQPEDLSVKVANAFQYGRNQPGNLSPEGLGFEVVPEEERAKVAQPSTASKFKPAPRSGLYLSETEFKPIMYTVKDILPEGVFLLAASPKIGKSWLTLQIALAVASSGQVLGQDATQGEALVLALEDSDRRLKSRLAVLDSHELPREALARLHFETHWPRVDEGGAQALDEWLDEHPETRLVVVDVLECLRPRRDAKANPYGEDYAALAALKEIAARRRITVVVVHHTRKAPCDDVVQLISGTQGLAGAADGILVLARARGGEEGELHIIARDLPKDGAYAVAFRDGRWTMRGPAAQVARTELQQDILAALRSNGAPMAHTEITAEVGRAKSTVTQALKVMVRDGLLARAGKKYALADLGFEPADGTPFEGAASAA